MLINVITSTVADLKEGARDAGSPGHNFFIFMQFSGKLCQIIGWRLPLGSPGYAIVKYTVLRFSMNRETRLFSTLDRINLIYVWRHWNLWINAQTDLFDQQILCISILWGFFCSFFEKSQRFSFGETIFKYQIMAWYLFGNYSSGESKRMIRHESSPGPIFFLFSCSFRGLLARILVCPPPPLRLAFPPPLRRILDPPLWAF